MKKFKLKNTILVFVLVVLIFGCTGCWFFDTPEGELLLYTDDYLTSKNIKSDYC